MAKLISLHEMELNPGVNAEAFEQFARETLIPLPTYPGWKASLLKGDRGARDGKYAMLLEIDSVDARDRYFPAENQGSEAAQQFGQQHPEIAAAFQQWATFTTTVPGQNTIYTDYVVLDH